MIRDPKEAREFIAELKRQPEKFVFTNKDKRPIFWTVLALVTPMYRDDDSGKKLAQAHVLMEDLQGRGKTATLTHLSSALNAKIGKIEGTHDTLPRDLKGGEEADRVTGKRTLFKGPLHSHIFSADEITRMPPKSQSPLYGAMDGAHVLMIVTDEKTQEKRSEVFPLYPVPGDSRARDYFIVIATANPIDFEGVFEMPEAQKDRFTYKTAFGLPAREDEKRIRAENVTRERVEMVGSLSDILDISEMVDKLLLSEQADELIQRLIDNSRPSSRDLADFGKERKRYTSPELIKLIDKYVVSGCSPRRNLHMQAAAKAYAWITGEDETVRVEHVQAIAPVTMPHVIMLKPTLESTVTPGIIVDRIVRETWLPQ